MPVLDAPTATNDNINANAKGNHNTLLEASYSSITPEELDFVREQTGIQSDVALREHILNVQAEAFRVHPYPCIRRFAFIKWVTSPNLMLATCTETCQE